MSERFVLRRHPEGFSVVDTWSGQPAIIAMAAQTGLSELDAGHTAALFNERETARRAANGSTSRASFARG